MARKRTISEIKTRLNHANIFSYNQMLSMSDSYLRQCYESYLQQRKELG